MSPTNLVGAAAEHVNVVESHGGTLQSHAKKAYNWNFGWRLPVFRFLQQLFCINPFKGDVAVSRVWITRPGTRGKTLPFPTRRNYHEPLEILSTFFAKADTAQGRARNNRYLEVPGFDPILVTRDPQVIRAVLTATGAGEGRLDRDTMPSTGIARATGPDTLLFSNGPEWQTHRKASAKAFGKTSLFTDAVFENFEQTFRNNVEQRLDELKQHFESSGTTEVEIALEPEIKCIMMEMLLFNFFGAKIDPAEVREKYIPAIDTVIEHIVRDTINEQFDVVRFRKKDKSQHDAELKEAFALFERLTDLSMAPRSEGTCAWARVDTKWADEDLRSNVKVFLAGALEATTSYAAWAISHLARHAECQSKVFQEVRSVDSFKTDAIDQAVCLKNVLRETLRLTPSLYFLPRKAVTDTWISLADGSRMLLPAGTHVLLDVWHSNRIQEFWGEAMTGYNAEEFHPQRWEAIDKSGCSKDHLHFGFGHGARVCPGKHLGELEASLVVGGIVKLFEFEAITEHNEPKAGVSTKPKDGTLVRLRLR